MKPVHSTRRLVRLAIRRDRITVTLTSILVLAMVAGSIPALVNAYPGFEEQVAYVSASAPSVVGRIFQGTVQDVSLGTIIMAELYLNVAVIMAIMSIFIVSRHTRQNEESGAGELIGSTVVGRSAPLTAAIYWAVAVNILLGLLIFASLSTELDVAGSLLMASSLSMIGIFFASVSAITVQLSDYKRGANMLAIMVLGLFFIIRSFGDALGDVAASGITVEASWITWLSPIGWGYQVLPYTENNILPLMMLIFASILAFSFAYILMSKRDIGSSIFKSREGINRARESLLKKNGLTTKIQRGGIIAWSIGAILGGILIGVVVNDFRQTFEENENFQELLATENTGGDFTDTIIAAMFPLIAAMLAGVAVTAISKVQDEEQSGRLEYLLGTALTKVGWLRSHIKTILLGSITIIVTLGLAGWLGFSISAEQGESVDAAKIITSALVSLPALILFGSALILVFSIKGKLVKSFAWIFYAYSFLINQFAAIFKWPDWVTYASPFSHTPLYPTTAEFDSAPVIIMSALALFAILLSLQFFNKRDLNLK